MGLSSYRLDRDLSNLDDSGLVDLVVVGGGITGISLAREAAARGLRTVLFERDDFGSGTSAATTKYIHGGIRYLEQYDIGVVRESLRERRILALGAPHLVEQTRFIMPAWRWSKPSTALLGAGVALYDMLAFDRNHRAPSSLQIPHPRWMSRRHLLDAVPWLDPDGLQGAFAYHDTLNIHPERLLLAYAKSAVAAGARLFNHVEVDGFVIGAPTFDGDGHHAISGVTYVDRLTGRRGEVRARVVVNAAGPWIDRVLQLLGIPTGVRVVRSKGVHVLTRPLGGSGRVHDAVFARARSGRHVIVSPWMGHSFIGPTDTPLTAEDDQVTVDAEDVDLILETVNSTMSSVEKPLTIEDVELTTVGVRPLVQREESAGSAGSTYEASRAHEFYHHIDQGIANLWSIGGGKWTTARATAEQLVDRLLDNELASLAPRATSTRRIAVAGAFAWAEDAEPFLAAAERDMASVPPDVARHVARLYGTEWRVVADVIESDRSMAARVAERCLDIAAQVVVAVTHEGARTLSDIVDRRLVLGTVGTVSESDLQRVADIAGPLLGWDRKTKDAEVQRDLSRRRAFESHWRNKGPARPEVRTR